MINPKSSEITAAKQGWQSMKPTVWDTLLFFCFGMKHLSLVCLLGRTLLRVLVFGTLF